MTRARRAGFALVLAFLTAGSAARCRPAGEVEERGDAPRSEPRHESGSGARATTATVQPADAATVLRAVQAPGARAVLVNIWATWCEPCREEFPDLLRLHRAYRARGLRLVLVSGDFDRELPAVRRFLAEQGVDFPSFIKSGDDMAFIDGLEPRWSGALPATLVFDGAGRAQHFWEGKASYETLERRVLDVLNASPGHTPRGERT